MPFGLLKGLAPRLVSQTLLEIVSSHNPRLRYLIGQQANELRRSPGCGDSCRPEYMSRVCGVPLAGHNSIRHVLSGRAIRR
jgi:hypothetical protein